MTDSHREEHMKFLSNRFFSFQAFLEMASEEAAVTMVNYYTSATPSIRSQPVYIQYSTHRELKTDNMTNQVRSSSSGPTHGVGLFV